MITNQRIIREVYQQIYSQLFNWKQNNCTQKAVLHKWPSTTKILRLKEQKYLTPQKTRLWCNSIFQHNTVLLWLQYISTEMEKAYKIAHAKLWVWKISTAFQVLSYAIRQWIFIFSGMMETSQSRTSLGQNNQCL